MTTEPEDAAARRQEGPCFVECDAGESGLLGATIVATPASSVASCRAGESADRSDLTSEGGAERYQYEHERTGWVAPDRLADDMAAVLADLSLASRGSARVGDDVERAHSPAPETAEAPEAVRPSARRRSGSHGGGRGRNAANAAVLSGLVCGLLGLGVGVGLSLREGPRRGVPAVVGPSDGASALPAARSGRQREDCEDHARQSPTLRFTTPQPTPPTPGNATCEERPPAGDADSHGAAPGGDARDARDAAAVAEGRAPLDSAVARARRQPKPPEEERWLQEKYGGMDLEERAFRILVDLGMVEVHPDPGAATGSYEEEEEDDDEVETWRV